MHSESTGASAELPAAALARALRTTLSMRSPFAGEPRSGWNRRPQGRFLAVQINEHHLELAGCRPFALLLVKTPLNCFRGNLPARGLIRIPVAKAACAAAERADGQDARIELDRSGQVSIGPARGAKLWSPRSRKAETIPDECDWPDWENAAFPIQDVDWRIGVELDQLRETVNRFEDHLFHIFPGAGPSVEVQSLDQQGSIGDSVKLAATENDAHDESLATTLDRDFLRQILARLPSGPAILQGGGYAPLQISLTGESGEEYHAFLAPLRVRF